MVFISDRDKGLHAALLTVFPNTYHSYYYQHLVNNIQKEFGLAYRTAFWKIAYTYTKQGFLEGMA
jgi:hypothetical protein